MDNMNYIGKKKNHIYMQMLCLSTCKLKQNLVT